MIKQILILFLSQKVINDGEWHRVGITWDDDYRILYVDNVIAAIDIIDQAALQSSEGDLYIGVGVNLEAGTFFSGLIDDVCVYNRVITP